MKKSILLISLFISLTTLSQPKFQLGVNLDDNGAFVNIINHTNRYSNATSYDSLGWPKSNFDLVLLDGRPATEWSGSIDDPETYRVNYSGRYKSSFKGIATINASGTSVSIENKTYDSPTNTTTFDIVIGGFPNANHGMVFLNFSATQRTSGSAVNTGITNLKVNRPGYPLSTTKIFTDEFISLCKAADFACYRYYNLQNIWDGEPTYPATTKWENRKTPLDASQRSMAAINGKRDAWCWDYIVELSNILKKDIWVNIHMSCDSNYVSNLAKFLKQKLDPSINIYVENSNEVWSPTQLTHGPYNKSQADFYKITFDQNYARRSVELSKWFSLVYGSNEINKKIRVILAGQQGYHGRSDNHLNYIKNTFGEPKNYIYANSMALYFGSTKASDTDPLVINDGMIADINSQITTNTNAAYRPVHITKANTWNLPGGCTSYEGGPHLPAGGGTANLNNQILAHRTAKMKDAIELSYLQGFKNLGGGLAMYFTLSSAYNRYGCWGLTDDYTNPERNYKMQAMRKIISTTVGIDKSITKHKTLIYPNPANDYIEIIPSPNSPSFQNSSVEIYTVLGERVISVEAKENMRIDISGLAAGVYFVKVGEAVGRFVKE
ncbi:MAG: T9SS type A sorting domain-containing protein [Bacteroidia bacterium]